MKLSYILIISILCLACKEEKKTFNAQQIIDNSITASCSGNCDNAMIDFAFRKRKYKSTRNGSEFSLERSYEDSTGVYREILTNRGFEQYKNDSLQTLADSTALKLSNSVNSVHYFAQLPFGLNDPAVKKELLPEATIKDKKYHVVKVTFSEEGGGTDFEDEFVYWINQNNFFIDYLSYSYAVDGGGIRFREAYNPRTIEGIRFVDYNNYKPDNLNVKLTELPDLFESGKLKLLSKIETEDVQVTLIPQK